METCSPASANSSLQVSISEFTCCEVSLEFGGRQIGLTMMSCTGSVIFVPGGGPTFGLCCGHSDATGCGGGAITPDGPMFMATNGGGSIKLLC